MHITVRHMCPKFGTDILRWAGLIETKLRIHYGIWFRIVQFVKLRACPCPPCLEGTSAMKKEFEDKEMDD